MGIKRDVARRFPGHRARFERSLIWILGSPRSGSSWLRSLIHCHPDVVGIKEPLIGAHFGALVESSIGSAVGSAATPTVYEMSRAKPAYFFSDANRDSWQPTMRRLVLDRLETTAASISATGRPAKATVIQEPHGTEGISLLFEVLPESRLLFLLRDGRDVIDSVVDAASALASHGTWPIPAGSSGVEPLDCDRRRSLVADAAYAWLQRTDATRAVVERLPSHQALQVRYEDLRSDTDAELARILRWAGLDLDDERRRDIVERLAFERVPADQTGPGKFSRSASPGQWRVNLTTVEQCEVHSIIGARLEELGYAVP